MARTIFHRLAILPVALFLANFLGFTYSHLARSFHEAQNPYGSAVEGTPPILAYYREYLQGLLRLDFGNMPVSGITSPPILDAILGALGNSLGLLILAFCLSILVGLALGSLATHHEPSGVAAWMAPFSALGQAMPGFYLGTLFILAGILYIKYGGPQATSPLPLQGVGWDLHLVLPTLALMLRPSVQIAQLTSNLLSVELGKEYIIAARSRGNTWRMARWKHGFRNILAPVILMVASSFRILASELILVEFLFSWPGLGRLLALALIPPSTATVGGLGISHQYFLHPELVAVLLPMFTFLFLVADGIATVAAQQVDHRLQSQGEGSFNA